MYLARWAYRRWFSWWLRAKEDPPPSVPVSRLVSLAASVATVVRVQPWFGLISKRVFVLLQYDMLHDIKECSRS